MKEKVKFINGECGEQLSVSPTRVKSEDQNEHEGVIIEVEGLVKDSNGDFCIVLSPYMAKVLAKEIEESADEAYEVNYHLLADRTPF